MSISKLISAGAKATFVTGPFHLIVFVTARCNARCSMCFYLEEIENANANLRRELKLEEFQRVFEKLGPTPYVSLSGGEPFLRKDIKEIMAAAAESCQPMTISVPTNCSMPERVSTTFDELCARYPQVQFEAQVSLDGVGVVHDTVRKIPGLFELVVTALNELDALKTRHANLSVKLVATYSSFNSDHVDELIDYAGRHLTFDRMILAWAHGNCSEETKQGLTLTDYHEALRKVENLNETRRHRQGRSLRLARRVKRAKERLRTRWERDQSLGQYCNAGNKIVVLSELGEIYPCEQLSFSLGNVRESDYDLMTAAQRGRPAFHQAHPPAGCHCEWGCGQNVAVVTNPKFWIEALGNPP